MRLPPNNPFSAPSKAEPHAFLPQIETLLKSRSSIVMASGMVAAVSSSKDANAMMQLIRCEIAVSKLAQGPLCRR